MNFVSARKAGKKFAVNRIRDAFLDLPIEHKKMLKISQTSFVEHQGILLVLGDEALETANLLNKEARRPMSGGVIAAGEIDAQQVIGLMIKKILGDPIKKRERCCYSVPAPAVDVVDSDTIYHSAVLKKILEELGYEAVPTNEAMAIIFSECAKSNFSGLGISYGSGMTNVCLSYNAMSALEFSLGRGGDWIDKGAAKAVGTTAAKICSVKENKKDPIDLNKPKSRDEEAIKLYMENLIDYTIKNIIQHFSSVKSEILVPKPIPIVVSGGTSLAGGFLDRFKERFEILKDKFPSEIEISEIRAADDPLSAVATGLLLLAQDDDD
jgi:actin-like ATPase involved in cell morphogenesis